MRTVCSIGKCRCSKDPGISQRLTFGSWDIAGTDSAPAIRSADLKQTVCTTDGNGCLPEHAFALNVRTEEVFPQHIPAI